MTKRIIKTDKIDNTKFEKYTKIPVTIEAYQTDEEIEIETLEGIMKANKDDWIIKGVKGELYPCKPDVFKMTYKKGMTDRFMVDDAGTLIDLETREMYDIVEEVCPVMNKLNNDKIRYKTLAEHRRTEIIQRVATLQNIVEKYIIGEIPLKNDVNPNPVKQVLK